MSERYRFIDAEKAQFAVVRLCSVMQVSTSGFYGWRAAGPSRRSVENLRLTERIREVHTASRGRYGAPRVHRALRTTEDVSLGRVARLMAAAGLQARRRRPYRVTTDSKHSMPIAPNLVCRDFGADEPNKLWVSDTTYIRTREGWLYLAVTIDLWSRRVVGWAMGAKNDRHLVIAAFQMAAGIRTPEPGWIHHSDRGSTYASAAFRAVAEHSGAQMSMSRKGDCWDNAVAESFFASLKRELDVVHTKARRDAMKTAVVAYLVWFNNHRLHSTLDYHSPADYERASHVRPQVL